MKAINQNEELFWWRIGPRCVFHMSMTNLQNKRWYVMVWRGVRLVERSVFVKVCYCVVVLCYRAGCYKWWCGSWPKNSKVTKKDLQSWCGISQSVNCLPELSRERFRMKYLVGINVGQVWVLWLDNFLKVI